MVAVRLYDRALTAEQTFANHAAEAARYRGLP